jgi:hypothetical protein
MARLAHIASVLQAARSIGDDTSFIAIEKAAASEQILPHLTTEQKQAYDRDGFILVPSVFTHSECDEFVAHAEARKEEQVRHRGENPDVPLEPRCREPGTTDPELDMVLHPKICDALSGCMEVDGWPVTKPVAIQSMYFWQGSEQRRHQDQFYLPECMSAWCAFEKASPRNGTIYAQAGSHKGRLLVKGDFAEGGEFHQTDYNDGVDQVFKENAAAGLKEVPVIANKGDVFYFSGILIHRGGPIQDPGSSRHVFANHYVPADFDGDQQDRKGAGTAKQYDNWGRGGIGRYTVGEKYDATERPTRLEFGVQPGAPLNSFVVICYLGGSVPTKCPHVRLCFSDGSGRAFMRQDTRPDENGTR